MTLHSTSSPAPAQPAAVPPRHETLSEQDFQDSEQAAAKAFRRILPFIFICYVVSYLDRTNVSFAALGMNADLGITAEQFGFGAGMFFIGYFLFEIPSNLIMQKVGARIWIARIMISWGLISMATAFISGPVSFAVARFCLGVAEAGFTPASICSLPTGSPAAGAPKSPPRSWSAFRWPISSAHRFPAR